MLPATKEKIEDVAVFAVPLDTPPAAVEMMTVAGTGSRTFIAALSDIVHSSEMFVVFH